ncbi:MAG TPA: hypothetical protein VNQ77_05135 [Frankiaceae bacterium]|nr:hypothetical protein [Frankiaceae bacterium]
MRRHRWMLVAAATAAVMLASTTPATAKPGSQVTLKFWRLDGTTTATGFTSGPSADGGGKAVTLDGGTTGAAANDVYAISFEGWWGQPLSAVSSLKVSTQEPLTGGSPRISVTLSTTSSGSSGWDAGTLFLDPNYCNTSNANGWRTSNWRGGVLCTIWDDQGRSYTGTSAVYDQYGTLLSPAVSAWDVMLASGDHAGHYVYYAFLIQDQPIRSRVDRITIDSKVFTK